MNYSLILSGLLLFSSCATEKETVTTTEDVKLKGDKKIIATLGQKETIPQIPFTINDLKIEGNNMFVEVNCKNDCKSHSYKMIGLDIVSNQLRPIRNLQLAHSCNLKLCEESYEITTTLEIDIRNLALKKENGFLTNLVLEGWNGKIDYIFQEEEK